MSARIGPIGTYGNPIYAGQASAVRGLFDGSESCVLVLGDSIAPILVPAMIQAWHVTVKGRFLKAGDALGSTDWYTPATIGYGGSFSYASSQCGLGSTYPLAGALEMKFSTGTRSVTPVVGDPVTLISRIASAPFTEYAYANRILSRDGINDWLPSGATGNARFFVYQNSNGCSSFVRPYIRGSGTLSAYRGHIDPVEAHAASPAYVAYDVPFVPGATEDLFFEIQASAEGVAIPNGKNFAWLGTMVTRPDLTGLSIIDLSFGGSKVGDWLDTSIIASSAWTGMLPLFSPTPTHAIIALTAHGPATTAEYRALKAILRATLPNIKIIWLCTHTLTTTPGSAETNETNSASVYVAADLTEDAYISLNDASPTQPQMVANGMLADTVHPGTAGAMELVALTRDLMMQLMGDISSTDVRVGVDYSLDGVGVYGTPATMIEDDQVTLFAFAPLTGAPVTGDAANITAYVRIDDGAVVALTDTSASEDSATHAAGQYTFNLTETERTGSVFRFTGVSSTSGVEIVPVTMRNAGTDTTGQDILRVLQAKE